MEKWVGFVGSGRTHGQGMWKFTIRLGNLQKGEKQQEKEGWGEARCLAYLIPAVVSFVCLVLAF